MVRYGENNRWGPGRPPPVVFRQNEMPWLLGLRLKPADLGLRSADLRLKLAILRQKRAYLRLEQSYLRLKQAYLSLL